MKKLTVGKLKEKLKDVPDDLVVELWSDTGVEQSYDGIKVVIENAYRHTCKLKDGEKFEDGTNSVDFFIIYANYRDEEEE